MKVHKTVQDVAKPIPQPDTAVQGSKPPQRHRKLWWGLGVALTSIAAVAIIGGTGFMAYQARHDKLPKQIKSQLTFSPFVVTDAERYTTDSFKYDYDNKGFSFIVRPKDGGEFTISQQETPDSFTDIPALFQKILGELNSYDTIGTFNGTAYITRPKNNQQVAVMNEKGVLMFIHSSREATSAQWKALVESLDIYKLREGL